MVVMVSFSIISMILYKIQYLLRFRMFMVHKGPRAYIGIRESFFCLFQGFGRV